MTTARASGKKTTLNEVLGILEQLFGSPVCSERAEDPLVDHLLVGVLGCHVDPANARTGVQALADAFLDMNEARSSPLTELSEVLAPYIPAPARRQACSDIRMALQDVWDGTHGLDLEPLRGREPEDQRSFLKDLPNTQGGPAALVFQIALGEQTLAFGPREQHLLDRFGLLPRSSSPTRLRQAMERKIPAPQRYRFAWLAGAASHLFEEEWDPSHPFCKLLIDIRAKEVIEREREQKREEQRRKQEERRRQLEEVKRQRAEEKARKAREREEKRKAAEEARKAREAARKEASRKKAEAKKKAEEQRRAAARKKADALKKKAAAKKKAEALKKKAAAKKKAEALKKKKAAAKKKAEALKKKKAIAKKKTSAKTKTNAKKKTAAKKKTTAKKKTSAKKRTAGRTTSARGRRARKK